MWKQRDDDVEKGLVMRPINLELMNEMERMQEVLRENGLDFKRRVITLAETCED